MKDTTARVGWLLAVPLLLVNSAASWGQAGWAHEHIAPSWVLAGFFAVTIESIGVYLAGMAHAARMADQSAGSLQLGAYLVGLFVGFLNYWHWAGPAFAPTAQAVVFGVLSSISPWLWAIYSRYRNRDRLAELGQVDVRGVKLSTSRKLWHPVKSVSVIRFASWEGIIEPNEAVRAWSSSRSIARHGRDQAPASPTMVDSVVASPADQVADPLGLTEKLAEWRQEIERWTSATDLAPREAGNPWQYAEPLEDDQDDEETDQVGRVERRLSLVPPPGDQSYGADRFVQTPAMREELGDPVEPVFRAPERPTSDEDLLARFDYELRDLHSRGKLNRYQVEQLTGAARRQADRLIEHIETHWEKSS
jgi:hypothetical protein